MTTPQAPSSPAPHLLIRALRAKTADFPETFESALFAYEPERLSDDKAMRLTALYQSNDLYKRMIIGMRRDEKFLKPQYGL